MCEFVCVCVCACVCVCVYMCGQQDTTFLKKINLIEAGNKEEKVQSLGCKAPTFSGQTKQKSRSFQ